MNRTFDIGIDDLRRTASTTAVSSGKSPTSGAPPSIAGAVTTAGAEGLDRRPSPDKAAKKFFIETFGCQMNVHDSEKVAGVLMGRGYRPVESATDADLLLYNTCSIREKAAQKVFSRLADFKWDAKENRKVIGVLGCVAQQEGEEIFERAPWVSLVCGSASYRKLPELVERIEQGGRRVMGLDLDTEETFETEITRRDNPFRAYLTIIEGCDYACAYCVVPRTRGPERSRSSAAVLEDVRRLAGAGYTEIQLLGQTVNSYRDPSSRGMNFVGLLRAVAEVSGIRRVRFTTSHPNDFHREIVEAIDEIPALCEHIHLPVQSGSTRVLRAMKRTYTREEYLQKISWIQAARRSISVTSDIIVGFPGETDADLEETITLLDAAQYDGVFAFKYSPRPNTPALTMPDAISEDEKGKRLAIVQDRQRQIQVARNEKLIGQEFEVLVDGRHAARGQWAGRTSSHRVVNFTSAHDDLLGKYVTVRVTRSGPNSLAGEHAGS
ncbi:MAG TPA: tRNA (N6-isopentenyl adenosine(37)-C2)-methylthiotransferase MiaB [Verrucomicrobiae bacterium]|nr:tRNA (N6-isopentenyl adenosine(37)-C2)-methylthiotransferase MiaB [Verrucomicrobiae bacterium]